MKILVVNGVNLNMLGKREPEIYGSNSYSFLVSHIKKYAKTKKVKVKILQSNYEGRIVEIIQKAYNRYQGIIINAGAYTHTSIAILDALKSVNIPTVEVHLSDIQNREDFRKKSFISIVSLKCISGKGEEGYFEAIDYLLKM